MSGQKQHRIFTLSLPTVGEEHVAAMEDTNSFLPAYDTSAAPAADDYDPLDHFEQASESFFATSAITTTDVPPAIFQEESAEYDFLDPQLRPDFNQPSVSDQQDAQDANMFGAYNQGTQYGSYGQGSLMLPSDPANVATNTTNCIAAMILARQEEHLNPLAQQQQQQYGSVPDVNALRGYRQGLTGHYPSLSTSHPLWATAIQQEDSDGPPRHFQQEAGLAVNDAPSQGFAVGTYPSLSDSHPLWAAAIQREDSDGPPRHFQQEAGLDANDASSQGFIVSTYPLPSALNTVDPANLQRDGLGASPGGQQQMPGADVNASTAYDQPPPYDDSDKCYPLLSPSNPPNAAAHINNYNIARDFNGTVNGTVNATFQSPFHGSLHNTFSHAHQQQQQQHPYNLAGAPLLPSQQQNNTFNFNQPNENVYNEPLYNQNNQTQHPSYANTAPTAPATPVKQKVPPHPPRTPGVNVGKPVPAHLLPLIKALKDLPDVSSTQKHPERLTLKNPFQPKTYDTATPAQRLIRDNFYSGRGILRDDSDLMKWDGDLNVFTQVVWDFIVQGEKRWVNRDEDGKRITVKKVKGEEGGEVKKVKKQKRKKNGAAEEGSGEVKKQKKSGAAEEGGAEGGVGGEVIAEEKEGDGQDTSEQGSSGSGSGSGSSSSEGEARLLKGLPCNKVGELLDTNGGDLVGELISGDANELFKSGLTADGKGRFRDENGKCRRRCGCFPGRGRGGRAGGRGR